MIEYAKKAAEQLWNGMFFGAGLFIAFYAVVKWSEWQDAIEVVK